MSMFRRTGLGRAGPSGRGAVLAAAVIGVFAFAWGPHGVPGGAPVSAQEPVIIGGSGAPSVEVDLGAIEGGAYALPAPPPRRHLLMPGSKVPKSGRIVLIPPKTRAVTIHRPRTTRSGITRPGTIHPGLTRPGRALSALRTPRPAAKPVIPPRAKTRLPVRSETLSPPAKRLAAQRKPVKRKAVKKLAMAPPPPPPIATAPPKARAPAKALLRGVPAAPAKKTLLRGRPTPPAKARAPAKIAKKAPRARAPAKAPPPPPPPAKIAKKAPQAQRAAKAPPSPPRSAKIAKKAPKMAKKVPKIAKMVPKTRAPAMAPPPPPPPVGKKALKARTPTKAPPPLPAQMAKMAKMAKKAPQAPAATAPPPPAPMAKKTKKTKKAAKPAAPVAKNGAKARSNQIAALPPAGAPIIPGKPMAVIFKANSSGLLPKTEATLASLVNALLKDDGLRLQIIAYAAGSANNASQARRLSLSRALAVRSYLIEKGVHSTRMDVRALGNKFKTAPGDRVDLIVVTP